MSEMVRSIPEELRPDQVPFMLAVSVFQSRIASLSEPDRDDLFELFPDLIVGDDESKTEATKTVFEILERSRHSVRELPDNDDDGYRKWSRHAGDVITRLRTKKGMTQAELAEKAGLDQPHISRIETGKFGPNAMTVGKIANALGVAPQAIDPSLDDIKE